MAIIIRQVLDYAVEHHLIAKNPYQEFKVEVKLFLKKKKPEDDSQVFLTNEQPLIEAEAYNNFAEKEMNASLGVILAFETGIRLGEIVALKESDISGSYIHVQRMEARVKKQLPDGIWTHQEYEIVGQTKSDAGNRKVYLTLKARKIIKMIIANNEKRRYCDDGFLFLNVDGRIHAKGVDCRIRKYCQLLKKHWRLYKFEATGPLYNTKNP